nr:transposase [Desulfuromonadales bacterium]
MMGIQAAPERLFYDFCLEDKIPGGHLVRRIDQYLDLSDLRAQLRPYYSRIGRPSVDPELMIRMLVVGYCFGIRSERRLCEEVDLNLAYRWFCGLGLDGEVPDHSTFSRNRHGRFRQSDALRQVFEATVARAIAEGLVGGEGFAVDASLIQADANKQRSVPGDEWRPEDIPPDPGQAVKDYLASLDDAAFGAASEVTPKFVSPSDPAAQWTGAMRGPAFFAYATNYLIDTDHAIIVDVEATRAIRTAEVGAARTMIDRVADRFGLKPRRLAGDSAYGSAQMLAWLVKERQIAPHIPVYDTSKRVEGALRRTDFTFDPERDQFTCPGGKLLMQHRRNYTIPRSGITKDGTRLYRASKHDCDACPLKPRCCPNRPARTIPRHRHEDARDVARALYDTPAFEQSRRDRKKVEMLFAHLKRILKLGRLRLRGPCGARDEFLLAATAQNLRKLAKLRPKLPPTAHPA